MYYPLAAAAPLYRVTGPGVNWPTPLFGHGAYFTKGGRYNYASEPTVYCAEDPLAVLAEAAFYEALEWQAKISAHRFNPVTYPLVSSHKFWRFSINPAPAIIDLEHAQAVALFQHTPHMLLNPSLNPGRGPHLPGQHPARDYLGTQHLASDVRGLVPPPGSADPRPEGVKAPAIRIKPVAGYRAHQLALFVFDPAANVNQPYQNRANLLMECDLEFQFLRSDTRGPVTAQTVDIDWRKPRFRISGPGAVAIPAYAPRPNAKAYSPNRWYNLELCFA
ncbi:MAG: RES family NAD+ phosphorylase [Planctomycetes bacterium]|nr:RES family NAD+ phosphorylase [Planctomycetota bacterium]